MQCADSQLSSDVRICFLGAALLFRLRGLARLTGWDKTSLFNFSTSCFLCLRANLYFSYSDIGQHLRLIIILIFPLKGPSTKKNNLLQTNFWTPRSVWGFGLKQSIFLWRISLNVRSSFPIISHALTLVEVAKLRMVNIAVVETKLTWWDTAYRCQFAQYCGEANATIWIWLSVHDLVARS